MDVVDLFWLIDQLTDPGEVRSYLEHPHAGVRLAAADWFGPVLEGPSGAFEFWAQQIHPELVRPLRRPSMPIDVFEQLIGDPDAEVGLAAIRRCWDVDLLAGLVDPRLLIASTMPALVDTPRAKIVRLHLLQISSSGDRVLAARAERLLDPFSEVRNPWDDELLPPPPDPEPVPRPRPLPEVGRPVRSWTEWHDLCAARGLPADPVTLAHLSLIRPAPRRNQTWPTYDERVRFYADAHEHLQLLLGEGGRLWGAGGDLWVATSLSPLELERRMRWVEGRYAEPSEVILDVGARVEVLSVYVDALRLDRLDDEGWREAERVVLLESTPCTCGIRRGHPHH